MNSIALTMIVKDGANTLERCLKSVSSLVEEIIIVDTGSIDSTKEIARSNGAKLFEFKWVNDFSAARNFALEQSKTDWNLILDADEYISSGNLEDIHRFINGDNAIGRIKIISNYHDGKETKFAQAFASRIIPRGVFYKGRIHEQVISDLPHKITNIVVNHDGYYETDKFDRNSKMLEQELREQPGNTYLMYQLAREYKGQKKYRIAGNFFKEAFLKVKKTEGYYHPLVVDFLYNLLEEGRIDECLELIETESPYLNDFPDFHFVSGLVRLECLLRQKDTNIQELGKIEYHFLKCLEIGDSSTSDCTIGSGSYLAAYNLGVLYEVIGQVRQAYHAYSIAEKYDYLPAINRKSLLKL